MLLASIVELQVQTDGSRLDAGRAEHSEAVEYDAHVFRREPFVCSAAFFLLSHLSANREGLKGQALRELLATSKVYKPSLRLDVKKCKARMAPAVFIWRVPGDSGLRFYYVR